MLMGALLHSIKPVDLLDRPSPPQQWSCFSWSGLVTEITGPGYRSGGSGLSVGSQNPNAGNRRPFQGMYGEQILLRVSIGVRCGGACL